VASFEAYKGNRWQETQEAQEAQNKKESVMIINRNYNSSTQTCCDGTIADCPDYTTKQHSTYPPLKIQVFDCNDAPYDLKDLVVEASMWSVAKLKADINSTADLLQFADSIGYNTVGTTSILHLSTGRDFERMTIVGFDDVNKVIQVQRGACSTVARPWKKGTPIKILRFINRAAYAELVYADEEQADGTIIKDKLTKSYLLYDWLPEDVCFSGKYFFEFKVLKINLLTNLSSEGVVSVNDLNYHCDLGFGVEWARRFPVERDGFVIEVLPSPTAEC
jgi:hypothetical protein